MKLRMCCIAFMLFTVALSCSEEESTPLTPPPSGIEIKLTLSPARVVVGESHEIVLEVINHGPPVELETRCEPGLGYRIRSTDGSMLISSPGPGCILASDPLRLAAGEHRVERYQRTANMTPTRYIVEAGILDNEGEYPWVSQDLIVVYP